IPAGAPPNGIASNFVDPPFLDSQPRIITGVMLPLTFFIFILRLYTRVKITRLWGADDCEILISAKVTLTVKCLYAIVALFVKVTLLVFYLRVFFPVHHTRVMIWIGVVFTTVFYVACSIATIVLFVPPKGRKNGWMSTRPDSMTEALLQILSIQGVIGVVLDFYILFIPMHLVVGLHLPFSRKLSVCGVFFTGFIACLCSIVGTVFRFKAKPSHDPLWITAPTFSLAIIELNAGFICSSLPVLLVLFRRL
ncbi:hypothetical protein K458DRAFT_258050, partial [Lentithecium fluviatile CBS 122367]